MSYFLFFLFQTLSTLCFVFSVLMFIRMILSWFIQPGTGGKITEGLYQLTECVVSPVRSFLERFEFVRNSFFDFSFMAAFLVVEFLMQLFTLLANACL